MTDDDDDFDPFAYQGYTAKMGEPKVELAKSGPVGWTADGTITVTLERRGVTEHALSLPFRGAVSAAAAQKQAADRLQEIVAALAALS